MLVVIVTREPKQGLTLGQTAQQRLRTITKESEKMTMANTNLRKVFDYSIYHSDTCMSDYLQDHHNREGEHLLGVSVRQDTTIKQVKERLMEEFGNTWNDSIPEELTSSMFASLLHDTFEGEDDMVPSSFCYIDLKEDDENDDTEECYAWFVLSWEPAELTSSDQQHDSKMNMLAERWQAEDTATSTNDDDSPLNDDTAPATSTGHMSDIVRKEGSF